MPHCVKAEGWAALPRDLLGPLIRQAAAEAQAGGPLSLAEAEALLRALGPCRHWRAVALEEVSCRACQRRVWWGRARSPHLPVAWLVSVTARPFQLSSVLHHL